MRPVAEFEVEVREAETTASEAKVTQLARDASVKAWILGQANGVCECCNKPAPFNGADGEEFIEEHHVR